MSSAIVNTDIVSQHLETHGTLARRASEGSSLRFEHRIRTALKRSRIVLKRFRTEWPRTFRRKCCNWKLIELLLVRIGSEQPRSRTTSDRSPKVVAVPGYVRCSKEISRITYVWNPAFSTKTLGRRIPNWGDLRTNGIWIAFRH